jgi:hypothetical protein
VKLSLQLQIGSLPEQRTKKQENKQKNIFSHFFLLFVFCLIELHFIVTRRVERKKQAGLPD